MVHRILFLSALLGLFVGASAAQAANNDIAGKWKVQTKLVAAMDPVNSGYHVGDVRQEKWNFKISGKKAKLTTPAGSIVGAKAGKAWLFDQTFDTGYGVLVNMHIVARAYSPKLMKGTIETRYYSAQFGYELGIDAWSFVGFRS
jgi:hypothetical protein